MVRLILPLALLTLIALVACSGPVAPQILPQPTPQATPESTSWNVRLVNSQGQAVELNVPVARTQSEIEKGLSRIPDLPPDGGMLFVFPGQVRIPFWMKDTLVYLSIAFIDEDGRIVDIQDMEPLSERLHLSSGSFRYALEVDQGFFARHGIKKGDVATLRLEAR